MCANMCGFVHVRAAAAKARSRCWIPQSRIYRCLCTVQHWCQEQSSNPQQELRHAFYPDISHLHVSILSTQASVQLRGSSWPLHTPAMGSSADLSSTGGLFLSSELCSQPCLLEHWPSPGPLLWTAEHGFSPPRYPVSPVPTLYQISATPSTAVTHTTHTQTCTYTHN